MDNKQTIEKIQLLKNISPSEEWILACRGRLAFRMEMDRKKDILKKDAFTLRELFAFWKNTDRRSSFSLAYSFTAALVVILASGGLTVLAANQSLPGSPFYPVKLAVERVRMSVSLSEDSKWELQAKLADTRLQELTYVVNSQESIEQKAKKVSQAVENIQDQLTIANNQLLPGAKAMVEPQKVLAAAKIVSDKAAQAGKALIAAKESLSGDIKPDLTAKLADATKTVEKAGLAALEAMVANQGVSSSTREEIAAKLEGEIEKTSGEIRVKEQEMAYKNSFADKLPIRAVLINQFEQSLDLLDGAREAMVKGDIAGAIEMLKAAREINSGTDKMTQNVIIDPEMEAGSAATSSRFEGTATVDN